MILSYHATVDATELTFISNNGRIYVETDEKHFGLYGQVTDKDGLRIIAVNDDRHHYLTSKCFTKQERIEDVSANYLRDYAAVRYMVLDMIKQPSPAISKIPTLDYIWSNTFSRDQREFFATRLDKNTVVYSSGYFPKVLARVIISGQAVIFVHYDGNITLKFMKCLYPNEKILIHGIKKINVDGGISSYISPSEDNGLRRYLRNHPISVSNFINEQNYIKPLTKEELRERAAKHAAITRAVRGQGTRSFDGKWFID